MGEAGREGDTSVGHSNFLACLPALQLCSGPPAGQGIVMVTAAPSEEN